MQTWAELHRKHKEKGYDRPLNSLRRKLEELIFYHMDPDSSKVTKATRDLFMTESAHVRFGAPLDTLKNAWDSRKASDEDKIKEQKKKEENRIGGAVLRDAMRKTYQPNLAKSFIKKESSDDTRVADSSFNAANDELSTCSDKTDNKENIAANKTTPSLKRKAHVIDLCSEDEAEPAAAKNMKRSRHNKTLAPEFWSKYLTEERESRKSFETDLMKRLDEGNKYNQEVVAFMKTAQEDTRSFQNSLLELLSRKL